MISAALLIVLDILNSAKRLVFVTVRQLFGMPFEQVVLIVDRILVTTRQLAFRARRCGRRAGAAA